MKRCRNPILFHYFSGNAGETTPYRVTSSESPLTDYNYLMAEKKPGSSRRRTPARKRTTARKRPPARKRARKTTRKTTRRSRKAPQKEHGLLFKCVFWPFLLVAHLTRNMQSFLKWPVRIVGSLGLMMLFIGILVGLFYYARATRYDLAKVTEMPARTVIYARDGRTELGQLHGDNRYIVRFDQVSSNFKKALISREDARFFKHLGIDFRSLARAAVQDIKRRRLAQGGSTLTIQLAENTFFPDGVIRKKSKFWQIDQKLLEMAIALRIEGKFSKNEILQHYMNRIFWGHSIRGIESASRTYFEKPASQLSLSESAMLAGIIRAPNTFSPFRHPKAARTQRDVTLGRMVHYGHITQAQADAAKQEPLRVRPRNRRVTQATYVMDCVRRELDRILEDANIKSGGLTVITTIDHTIQRSAELSIDRNLRKIERIPGYRHQTRKQWQSRPVGRRGDPQYLQAACVVIENKSGAVLAVVGGRSANESKYNRAIQAKRQIGSIFKPFVYLTAFNQGLMPKTWIPDGRIRPGEIDGAPRSWSPKNSDGKYKSYISAEDALIHSRNTSSVRIGNYAGIESVNETAVNVGFVKGIPKNPSSYLGSWEATPWQVASAYTVFPNNGDWYRPYVIQEIRNAQGERIYPGKGDSGKLVVIAADAGPTWCVSNVLQKVIDRGTGRRVRSLGFQAPCAGKTGTTDDYKDAWFAGYTGTLTCAVWVGLDTPRKIMNHGYGSTLAAPIWTDVMQTARRLGYPTPHFKPLRTQKITLCRWSAKRATNGCVVHHSAYTTYIPTDMLPAENDYCTIHPLRAVPVRQRQPPRAIPLE